MSFISDNDRLPRMRLQQRSAWPTKNVFQRVKRASDIALTSVGILVVSPLLVGTAIAIKLTGPCPIFFNKSAFAKMESGSGC